MKKRIIALFLILGMLIPIMACTDEATSNVSESNAEQLEQGSKNEQSIPSPSTPGAVQNGPKVTIKDSCVYLFVGSTHLLSYDVAKTSSTNKNVIWYSSTDCVTVSDGLVTGKKEGYAYVSANGGAPCLIYVIPKNMPTLSIDTNNQSINSKDVYTTCKIGLKTNNPEYCFQNASAGIRLRGNSTSGYAKKPYRIRFDSKRNLLGMNSGAECKSWVLLAEWLDDSLLRNTVSLSLASMIIGEYSSDWRYVSVYINGQYAGVYVLCEQSQINSNRIDIEEAGAKSTELMSGYLFEVDASTSYNSASMFKIYHHDYAITNLEGEEFTWTCNDSGEMLQYISLKNDEYSNDQLMFTKYYLRAIFDIIYNATYCSKAYVFKYDFLKDPSQADDFLAACKNGNNFKNGLVEATELTPRQAIERVIDIESLARMYIFSEMVCNNDDLKKSFYFWVDFTEDGTGKLTFGCPWDHDGAFVAWNSYNYRPTDKYFAAKRNPWYVMIMCNEWFVNLVRAEWQELYENNNGFKATVDLIPEITSTYAAEFEKEASLWSRQNSQVEHSQIMQNWLKDRIAWLDSQFGNTTQ